MKKETEDAINYLYRIVKVGKETAYNLVLTDLDIERLEIALNHIKSLNLEVKELKKEIEYYREQEREKADLETEIRFYRDSFTY